MMSDFSANEDHPGRVKRATDAVNARKDSVAQGSFRQWYHLMPPAGWMNDPNGFIYYKGRYHLFYQHNPYSPMWGSMHWGHASSLDLIHWDHHPIALAPSEPYDDFSFGGVFSGSSAVVGDRLYVLYTGCVNKDGNQVQTQCLAWSDDGIHFEKYPANPVIVCPPGLDPANFRDPKLWQHGGQWYCVVASRVDGDACCAIFRSRDLKDWEYKGTLARGHGQLGDMWECPDFFPLGDKYILQFSPMLYKDQKAIYLAGQMDYETCHFTWGEMGEIDAGFDFYGPQSMQDPNGRRIMVGWQNSWFWMPWFSSFGANMDENWCGFMSLPRRITLSADGIPRYTPADELELVRRKEVDFGWQVLKAGEKLPLEIGDNIHFEIEITIDLLLTKANLIHLHLRSSDTEDTLIQLDLSSSSITLDRSRSDSCLKGIITRTIQTGRGNASQLELRLYADTCSIELFTDGGRLSMASAIFSKKTSTGLYLEVPNDEASIRVRGWEMSKIF